MDLTAQLWNPCPPLERLLQQGIAGSAQGPDQHVSSPHPSKQVHHRLESGEILKLLAAYVDGATVPQLVKQFRVHRNTVLSHLEHHGVERRPEMRKLSDNQVADAALLYQEGTSLKQLGEHYGVHHETIRHTLKRHGVRLRPRRGWPPPSDD